MSSSGRFTNFSAIFRFGSIISGAIQSKLFARKGTTGRMKDSLVKKKHNSGSFSFLGGMQVYVLSIPISLSCYWAVQAKARMSKFT